SQSPCLAGDGRSDRARRERTGTEGRLCGAGMSQWPATKARLVLAALLRIGWMIKRQSGTSHRVLARPGWPDFSFAFHDSEDVGPRMLARIAKRTGLAPNDL